MRHVSRRSTLLSGLGLAAAPALAGIARAKTAPVAEADNEPQTHQFEMNIEDTRITLVGQQKFHTFAFAGHVTGPLLHVRQGDTLEVVVNNHTIHWHGVLRARPTEPHSRSDHSRFTQY